MDLEQIYSRGVGLELVLAAFAFPALFWITVPYGGRHRSDRWGPDLPSWIAWIVLEAPAPISFAVFYVRGQHTGEPVSLLLAAAFLIHYADRVGLQPLRLRKSRKRTPLLSAAIAGCVNVLNGGLQGLAVGHVHSFGSGWLTDPRFLLGATLFVVGFALNRWSDAVLHGLRSPGETGYRIPTGGLYERVSSPNYLGEIVQWLGWAIATWSSAGLAFFALTVANLAPRARSNHRWYRETFGDYPASRRALIPYVW